MLSFFKYHSIFDLSTQESIIRNLDKVQNKVQFTNFKESKGQSLYFNPNLTFRPMHTVRVKYSQILNSSNNLFTRVAIVVQYKLNKFRFTSLPRAILIKICPQSKRAMRLVSFLYKILCITLTSMFVCFHRVSSTYTIFYRYFITYVRT